MASNPSNPLQGKLLIPFIAPPNGGKGTQTKVLSERYDLPTFDMGATFRSIMKNEPDSELAAEIKRFTSAGRLVPIETVMKVFTKGFEDLAVRYPKVKGFILDGFPRNLEQANALLTLCRDKWQAELAKAVYLNVPDTVVEQRAVGRRFCSLGAHRVYNVFIDSQKPRDKKLDANGQPVLDDNGNEIWLCDEDGAVLEQRPDDQASQVQERLRSFHEETQPVINLFKQSGQLAEINGEQPVGKVTQDLEKIIQPLLGLSPTP